MAYPTVSAPYGLQAINRVDGLPYAGAIRQIAVDVSTQIYNGDIVRLADGGKIEKSTVTVDATTAAANYTSGVFVGCQYVNSQGQTVQAQYYPGNGATSSAVAFVVDDPMAAFKVALTLSNGAMTTANSDIVGTNIQVRQGTGSNTTGDSGVSVVPANGVGSDTKLPLRVIAVVPDTAANATAFTEVVVKFNNHQYDRPGEAYNYTA
jgi:hypothetical protein